MSDVVQCSDPSCTEQSVRLFECVHHCKKTVCLQHLIEHDRLIDRTQQSVDELRSLWATYTGLVDETKLHAEYVQRLREHEQLTRDVLKLCQDRSNNLDIYRLTMEKLRQHIGQEDRVHATSTESLSESDLVKDEPMDESESYEDFGEWDATPQKDRLKKENEQPLSTPMASDHMGTDTSIDSRIGQSDTSHQPTSPRRSVQYLSGLCPLRIKGAFGLTEEIHQVHLCTQDRYYSDLSSHLRFFHQLTNNAAKKIRRALKADEDPSKKILFDRNEVAVDEFKRIPCPFSVHYHGSFKSNDSFGRHCHRERALPSRKMRAHLVSFHRLNPLDADKLARNLQEHTKPSSE